MSSLLAAWAVCAAAAGGGASVAGRAEHGTAPRHGPPGSWARHPALPPVTDQPAYSSTVGGRHSS